VSSPHDWNFAGRVLKRLGRNSELADAATRQRIPSTDLADLIIGFAVRLRALGLQPEDRILISCGLNPASALAYLGAMFTGCVPVLLDERLLAENGPAVFTKSRAKAAWTAKLGQWTWAQDNGFLQLEGIFEPHPSDQLRPVPQRQNDLAVLMPTSGSTGVPRLVMVSHGNLIANTEAIIRSQHLRSDERALLIMPISYCYGASILHTHLYQGGGVVFDSRFMFPDKVLEAINAFQCTTFAGVPTVYNILLKRSHLRTIPLPGLRRFLQAGGALTKESIRELRAIVPTADWYTMYGQTEATARISCLPPDRLDEKLGSAGLPLDNVEVRIANDEGQECPIGETGQIQVRGPSICTGYLDEADATREKFADGWLKTGDLAFRDNDGFLWITGRASEFIKIRGWRVSFAEVEARVATVPGVDECAALGVPHAEAGEALALFVVAQNGASGLVESVQRALLPQWTCAAIKVLAELPRTTNGKIARTQLHTLL
jgi:acyl-CoA synthetase (AMP-forming)/AMP-acid ligase II